MIDDIPQQRANYEEKAVSRPEYVAAIVHLYRGELYRANSWRMRLDNTTNWAIITTAGLLSFSFGAKHHTHWVLLVGLLLITALLSFEARRFRFFDVWRFRVRMIEENFYGPILRRDPISPDILWGDRVANDLLNPCFKISFRAALRARFTRNYWIMYAVLLLSWFLKVSLEPVPVTTWSEISQNLSTEFIPWYWPVGYVALALGFIVVMLIFFPRAERSEIAYWGQAADRRRDVPAIDA